MIQPPDTAHAPATDLITTHSQLRGDEAAQLGAFARNLLNRGNVIAPTCVS